MGHHPLAERRDELIVVIRQAAEAGSARNTRAPIRLARAAQT
jgi:hypothetical protein